MAVTDTSDNALRSSNERDKVLEFLRSFISGGVNQDFKLWANELYQKLYRTTHETPERQPGDGPHNCPTCACPDKRPVTLKAECALE